MFSWNLNVWTESPHYICTMWTRKQNTAEHARKKEGCRPMASVILLSGRRGGQKLCLESAGRVEWPRWLTARPASWGKFFPRNATTSCWSSKLSIGGNYMEMATFLPYSLNYLLTAVDSGSHPQGMPSPSFAFQTDIPLHWESHRSESIPDSLAQAQRLVTQRNSIASPNIWPWEECFVLLCGNNGPAECNITSKTCMPTSSSVIGQGNIVERLNQMGRAGLTSSGSPPSVTT